MQQKGLKNCDSIDCGDFPQKIENKCSLQPLSSFAEFPLYMDNFGHKPKTKKRQEDDVKENRISKEKIIDELLFKSNLDEVKKLGLCVAGDREMKIATILESLEHLDYTEFYRLVPKICKFANQSDEAEKIFNILTAKCCRYSIEITKLCLKVITKSSNAAVILEQLELYLQHDKLYDYNYYLARLHIDKGDLFELVGSIHSNNILAFVEKQSLVDKIIQASFTRLIDGDLKNLDVTYETMLRHYHSLSMYSTKPIFILCQLLMIKIDASRSLIKYKLFHKRNKQFVDKIENNYHIEQLNLLKERVLTAHELNKEHKQLLVNLLEVYIIMENPFKHTNATEITSSMLEQFTNPNYKLKIAEYLCKLAFILLEYHLENELTIILKQCYDVYVPLVSKALKLSKQFPLTNYAFLDNTSLLNDIISPVCSFKINMYVKLLLNKSENTMHTLLKLINELDIVEQTPEVLLQLEECYVMLYKITLDVSLKEEYSNKATLLQTKRLNYKPRVLFEENEIE